MVDPNVLVLADALRQAVGDFVRAVRGEVALPTSARSETLGLLDRGGAMSVAALAQLRHVKHQSMRLVVAQLETEGLVGRSADVGDRRSRLVTLTEAGRRARAGGRAARAEAIGQIMQDRLSADDRAVLDAAVQVLNRMTDALTK